MKLPRDEHRKRAPKVLRFALVTVSSSRYAAKLGGKPYSDESQEKAAKFIEKAGHVVEVRDLVDDDLEMIRETVSKLLKDPNLDVVILIGGTGFSKKDLTIEAVKPLFEKEIEGFGEIFRWLSFQEVGASAFLSRATAGISRGRAIFCLPGSPHAIELALKTFLPEMPHLIYIARS